MKDLDILESYVTKSFANDAQMPGMQISAAASSAACPAGKMVQVVPGDSSELERTVCGKKKPKSINVTTCAVNYVGSFQNFLLLAP